MASAEHPSSAADKPALSQAILELVLTVPPELVGVWKLQAQIPPWCFLNAASPMTSQICPKALWIERKQLSKKERSSLIVAT